MTTASGLSSTPHTAADQEAGEDRRPDHLRWILVDLRDVHVLGEPLEPPEAPLTLLLGPGCREQEVDLLAALGRPLLRRQRDELAETRDERPVRAQAPERAHGEDDQREEEDDDERDQDPRLEKAVAERRLVGSGGARRRARVGERDRLGVHDGDLDVHVLIRLSGRAVAEQVLVRELEAELVVDLRQGVR